MSLGNISTQGVTNGVFKYVSVDIAIMSNIEMEDGATSVSDINVNMTICQLWLII